MGRWDQQNADVLSALRELQQHQAFSDFTIQLKQGEVRVNRLLLAAVSPIFKEMALQRPRNSFARLDMSHLSHEAWDCITQFYFNNKACLSLKIVAEVLEVSEWNRMDRLKNYCCEFLISCCAIENCLQIIEIAEQFDLEGPAQKAREVCSSTAPAGHSHDDFMSLEKSEPLEVSEKEELVTAVEDVCGALLPRLEATDADADTSTEVFQHVPLEKVLDDELENGAPYQSVSTGTPAMQVQAREELTERSNRGPQRSPGSSPRRRIRDVNGTLLVVGKQSKDLLCVYQWSPSEKKWIAFLGPKSKNISLASSATSGRTVFVTGGQGAFRARTDTDLFDLHSRRWSAGPKHNNSRGRHGMAVIHDRVFVVAGSNGNLKEEVFQNSVEEYSQTEKHWTCIGNLTVATSSCGVTAIGDTILVAGGNTDQSESLIQTFNVETRTAAVLDVPLPCPMRHLRAASLGNTAFFVGREGDLVQIIEVEGEFHVTSHIQLQEFGKKKWFGLHMTDTCVRVIGGEGSQSVLCWNHQGQKLENDEVGDLPEQMCVYGLHEVD